MNQMLADHPGVRNKVLAALPEGELQHVAQYLRKVRIVPGQILVESGQPIEHVFFLEDGMVSLIAETASHRPSIQVAMIGRESVVGCQAMLGNDSATFATALAQIPGTAYRLAISDLYRLVQQCTVFHRLCMGALESLIRQTMQTAACNARNTLAERCVRWLLMAHDRVDGDDLPITHEALSSMLGVRRSGVTVVASGLQDAGLVSVHRGRITIQDRPGLERAAGDMAWAMELDLPERPQGLDDSRISMPPKMNLAGMTVSAARPS